MKYKAMKTYFMKNQHYVCRFCAMAIGKWEKGQLIHDLAAYRRHKAILANGAAFIFSSCVDCAPQVNIKAAQKAFDACPETPSPQDSYCVESVSLFPIASELE